MEDDASLPDGEYGTALPSRDDLSEDGGRLPASGDETALPSREGLSEDEGKLIGDGLDVNDEDMLESGGGGSLNNN